MMFKYSEDEDSLRNKILDFLFVRPYEKKKELLELEVKMRKEEDRKTKITMLSEAILEQVEHLKDLEHTMVRVPREYGFIIKDVANLKQLLPYKITIIRKPSKNNIQRKTPYILKIQRRSSI